MPSTSSCHKSRRSSSLASPSLFKHRRDSRVEQKLKNKSHQNNSAVDLLAIKNDATIAATVQKTGKVSTSTTSTKKQFEKMNVNDLEVIDLCSPVVAKVQSPIVDRTSTVAIKTEVTAALVTQRSYESRTLTPNSERYSILPAFPASAENTRPDLLLANVPNHLLNEVERDRRRPSQYQSSFHVIGAAPMNILMNKDTPSFFWLIYQELFANVSEHLHVDMSIIDYNYVRLSKCVDTWRKERISRFQKTPAETIFDHKEYAVALEFYLQIDADLFYMKTCSFRDVQPTNPNKYLFCVTNPEACHIMSSCGNCGLCYPKYDVLKRGQPSVDFGKTYRHRFLNKYETILNCPCSCETKNVIYILFCPCGNFEYVGETGSKFSDRIAAHRYHGNRIMHETFLGEENFKTAHPDIVKSVEVQNKDNMRLYRHSTECKIAIQMFLNENPQYWRFVPMTNEEANDKSQQVTSSSIDIKSTDIRTDDGEIKKLIQNLPMPPANYRFSTRQYHLQYVYFQAKRDILGGPNVHLDLYNAKIIAVLPETSSSVLRQIVESLFITHAETNLNTSGHLVDNNNINISNNNNRNSVWCEGLIGRPATSRIKTTTAAVATSK